MDIDKIINETIEQSIIMYNLQSQLWTKKSPCFKITENTSKTHRLENDTSARRIPN